MILREKKGKKILKKNEKCKKIITEKIFRNIKGQIPKEKKMKKCKKQ